MSPFGNQVSDFLFDLTGVLRSTQRGVKGMVIKFFVSTGEQNLRCCNFNFMEKALVFMIVARGLLYVHLYLYQNEELSYTGYNQIRAEHGVETGFMLKGIERRWAAIG